MVTRRLTEVLGFEDTEETRRILAAQVHAAAAAEVRGAAEGASGSGGTLVEATAAARCAASTPHSAAPFSGVSTVDFATDDQRLHSEVVWLSASCTP